MIPAAQTGSQRPLAGQVVFAENEMPAFDIGDRLRVDTLEPIAHYRVPRYLRGKAGVVSKVIAPLIVNNEEEAYGRNAGSRGHYYRMSFALSEIWSGYPAGTPDCLLIEVFQSWLQRA